MSVNEKWFKILKLLSPKADAFQLFIQKKLTQFFEGLTTIPDDFTDYLHQVWLDIFPANTRELITWREQFGIQYFSPDEDEQRTSLESKWSAKGGQGKDYIQSILQAAGFNVQVHENNPPVDPDLFLGTTPQMQAGGTNAYAGRSDAYAGYAVAFGELLVNGPILTNEPNILAVCGNQDCCCGNNVGYAGYHEKLNTYDKTYEITDDSDYWPYFFFIGGDATRNSVTHELESIEYIDIPYNRENEFKNIILKLKPAMTWVGLIVNYV